MTNQILAKDITLFLVFILSWVNSFLVTHGHKPIPVIDESQVAWAITFVVSVWAMVSKSPLKSLFPKKADPVTPAPVTVVPTQSLSQVQENVPSVKEDGGSK